MENTGFQMALSPILSGRSQRLWESSSWSLDRSGRGAPRYWTARNKQTSFCSQPRPPPRGIQDVCVSSSLLCLNTVCGMTCEGGQSEGWEQGGLGCPLLAQPFLPSWIMQFLSAPPSVLGTGSSAFFPLPTAGSWCRQFAGAPSS